jgi:endonuclease/exonuclease/phosphatase family metal-dependent hydrolase
MRVLSWNLYHGRALVPAHRSLLEEFGSALDGFHWDVALLQEAPPRWFRELCRRTRSNGVLVETSRNWLPPLQSLLADLAPDLIKSWEGGSNQILVRHPGRIAEHRRLTLARRPERRRMQWTRLDVPGAGRVCVANLHASAGLPERAGPEVLRAAQAACSWSGDDPLVFGGDFNLRPARQPEPFAQLRERFGLGEPTGPRAIDHLLVRGLRVAERPRQLPDAERMGLSDHAPVLAEFVR